MKPTTHQLLYITSLCISMAGGALLYSVWIVQDCETLGAFRVGEVAYQCERSGRGW